MAQKPEDNSGFAKSLRDVGPYLGLGLQLAATIVLMVLLGSCLLYTSDAADERSSVDLGGRRIIKKKNIHYHLTSCSTTM